VGSSPIIHPVIPKTFERKLEGFFVSGPFGITQGSGSLHATYAKVRQLVDDPGFSSSCFFQKAPSQKI
jgi:hypothetical protein